MEEGEKIVKTALDAFGRIGDVSLHLWCSQSSFYLSNELFFILLLFAKNSFLVIKFLDLF